jgi:hypothetical protein
MGGMLSNEVKRGGCSTHHTLYNKFSLPLITGGMGVIAIEKDVVNLNFGYRYKNSESHITELYIWVNR